MHAQDVQCVLCSVRHRGGSYIAATSAAALATHRCLQHPASSAVMNEASDIKMGSVLGVMRACKPQDHNGKTRLLCQSTHTIHTAY
jgi:hypothetical protein